MGGVLFQQNQQSLRYSLWIFHKNRQTLIAQQSGNHLQISTTDNLFKKVPVLIKNFCIGQWIKHIEIIHPQNIFPKHNLLIVDQSGVYFPLEHDNPNVLLVQNPKIHLEELIDSLHPKQIIADGSNYVNLVNYWKKTCHRKNVLFYSTYEKGAIELN